MSDSTVNGSFTIDEKKVFSLVLMARKGLKYAAKSSLVMGLGGHFMKLDHLLEVVMMSAGGMAALTCAYNYLKFKVTGTSLEKLVP